MIINHEDYLMHHGVKGMKWGVRKQRPTSGRVRSAHPQQTSNYVPRKGDVTIKKGSTFQRITTNSNAGITEGVFNSYKAKDKDLYTGVLGRLRLSWQAQNPEAGPVALKKVTMEAAKDFHIPSKQVRHEQFKKLYQEDPEGVANFINQHERERYGPGHEIKFNQKLIDKKTGDMYMKFNDALAMGVDSQYGHVAKKFYNNLSKMGYDAVPDENDIKRSTFKGQAPIISFDTSHSIGKVTYQDLTASEVYAAYTRSIGPKTVRNVLYRGNYGRENITPDTEKKAKAYAAQIEKDKRLLNPNYTLDNLAQDWGVNRLSSRQIMKVSNAMDQGATHEEAVAQVVGMGNVAVDMIMKKFKI